MLIPKGSRGSDEILDQSRAPLWESLFVHAHQGRMSFHMPGHKDGSGAWWPWRAWMGKGLFLTDITELPDVGDLHCPTGPLLEAQRLAAQCFGSREAFFLVNGATAGIHAGLIGCLSPGDKVIVPRHAHRSVFGALVLSGAEPVYVYPDWHPWGFALGVAPRDYQQALINHPEARAVLVVSPTYEGWAGNIESIVSVCHEEKRVVICDEAHGAHFYFHPDLPTGALRAGADVVVHSPHKVLGALTQGGMLHLGQEMKDNRVGEALYNLQTTSPSFVLLASLDVARRQMAVCGSLLLSRAIEMARELGEFIGRSTKFSCLGNEAAGEAVGGRDPLKICLGLTGVGCSGKELAELLRERYGVEVEMAGPGYVLLMITFADGPSRISALKAILAEASKSLSGSHGRLQKFFPPPPPVEVAVSPREAFFAPKRVLKLEAATGQIAGETWAPYPPGIPLLNPGEMISPEVVDYIELLKAMGVGFQGPQDREFNSIKVLAI